jgi:hypothetical protein
VACSPLVSQPKPCMHFSSHSSLCYHSYNILWLQIIKFLIIHSSPSSLLGSTVFLSSPFLNTITLFSSHNVSNQVWY